MQPTKEYPAVRRKIRVNVSQQRAFDVFTQNMGQWWPKEHHIGGSPLAAVVVEPRSGGRWYEKDEDGSECDWGTVLHWEPPTRVVLTWHLNADFEFVADVAKASEVEIRFILETPERTRVELEHCGFERHGETGDRLRTELEKPEAWTYVLGEYGKLAGVMGATRTFWDFFFGFGLIISVSSLIQSVLFWQLAGLAKTDPGRVRPIIAGFLFANIGYAILAWKFFFAPPFVGAVLIAVALALAYLKVGAATSRPESS